MNRIKLLAAALALTLPAFAHAQSGWYAGVDVGAARSDAEIDEHFLIGGITDRGSSSTTGLRLRGGYRFWRFVAIELAYLDFGQFENHFDPDDCPAGAPGPCPVDTRTSVHGIVGSVVGIVPLGEHWFLDARFGVGKMKVEAQAVGALNLKQTSNNNSSTYGIGGGYRFNEHWEVTLNYSSLDQFDLGESLSGTFGVYNLGETSMSSLGFNYRF